MNEISNILSSLGDTLSSDFDANPFGLKTDPLEQSEYNSALETLSNSDDKFTNNLLKEKFDKLISEFLNDQKNINLDDKTKAQKLSQVINEELVKNDIQTGTKEWLQNYNAIFSSKHTVDGKTSPVLSPELRNALRANTVEQIINLPKDSIQTPQDITKAANTAWGEAAEIIYEHTEDNIRNNKDKLTKELAKFKEEIGKEGAGENNETIKWINDKFGGIANFNNLLQNSGINYQITKNDDDKYIVKETDNFNEGKVTDSKKMKNKGYRENLDSWNEQAGSINNLNLDDFDVDDAREKIDKLARMNVFDSNESIDLKDAEELLNTLTEANMYNIENGGDELNSAKLNLARRNLIKLIHDAESKQRKEDPDYKRSGSLDDAISSINTVYQLKNNQDAIVSGLNQAAKATGHEDYIDATNGDDDKGTSQIEKLINTINNSNSPSEYDLITETVNHSQINSIKEEGDHIVIKLKNDENQYKMSKNQFLEALDNTKDYAILYGEDPESNKDDKKIENFRDLFKDWQWDENENQLAASSSNSNSETSASSNLEFILNLPDDERAVILQNLGYSSIEELIEAISRN